jgi:hypothetical protein
MRTPLGVHSRIPDQSHCVPRSFKPLQEHMIRPSTASVGICANHKERCQRGKGAGTFGEVAAHITPRSTTPADTRERTTESTGAADDQGPHTGPRSIWYPSNQIRIMNLKIAELGKLGQGSWEVARHVPVVLEVEHLQGLETTPRVANSIEVVVIDKDLIELRTAAHRIQRQHTVYGVV